jgi:plastocyanin
LSDSPDDAEKKKLDQKKAAETENQPAIAQPTKPVAPRVGTPIGQAPTPRPQVGTPVGTQSGATSAQPSRPTIGTPVGTPRPTVGTPVGASRPTIGTPVGKPVAASAAPQVTASTSPVVTTPQRPTAPKPTESKSPKAPVKTLKAAGPIIVLILIVAAAFLGYYQIVYYPTIAPTSSTTTTIPSTPFNVTVTIPSGAAAQGKPASFYYQPDVITVYVGYNSTIIWLNNDSTVHTVTADGTPPDTRFSAWGPNNPSSYNNVYYAGSGETPLSVAFTFTIPGIYNYSCSYHPWMSGEVIVKAAPPGLSTSSSTA